MPPTSSRKFLDLVFGKKPDDLYVLIWSLPAKESDWFTDLKTAAQRAQHLAKNGSDVYFGLGLSKTDRGKKQRVTARSVAGIPGLWVDIDIANPKVHDGRKKYSESAEAIHKVMKDFPGASLIVNSGHGLHLYWLFREPWVFKNAAEQTAAVSLCMRWHTTVKAAFIRKGYSIDSTFDLSRVLRVVGTFNFKDPKKPKPVKMVSSAAYRFDLKDFDKWVLPEQKSPRPSRAKKGKPAGGIFLSADATPPFDKFEALVSAEPKFHQSWERKRSDLKDESASGYDLSLASFAARAEWTDEEIAALLISHRKKHGDDLKLREDYYRRTISKAREEIQDEGGTEAAEEVLSMPESDGKRQASLDLISARFGMKVQRIIKHKAAEPIYHIVLEGGQIALGRTPNLIDQRLLRYKIFDAINQRLPGFKPKAWTAIVDLMGVAIEEEAADEATTTEGIGLSWMTAYFSARKPTEEVREAITDREPFVKGDALYFFLDDFRSWVRLTTGERLSARQLSFHLKRAGAQRSTVYLGEGDNPKAAKPTTVSLWAPPEALKNALIYSVRLSASD